MTSAKRRRELLRQETQRDASLSTRGPCGKVAYTEFDARMATTLGTNRNRIPEYCAVCLAWHLVKPL